MFQQKRKSTERQGNRKLSLTPSACDNMINHWETKPISCKNKQTNNSRGKRCWASVAQTLQAVTFNSTFKPHSLTDQLRSHILFWHTTGLSLKSSGKCSCSICEVSCTSTLTACTLYQQAGTDFCITQISSVFIVQLHATFLEKNNAQTQRVLCASGYRVGASDAVRKHSAYLHAHWLQ